MVLSIAPNEEFDARCTVLDINDCGRASKIHDVPRRLVHPPHTIITNLRDNIPRAAPPQFSTTVLAQAGLCAPSVFLGFSGA